MSFDTAQGAYKSLRGIIAEHTSGVVFWTGSGLTDISHIGSLQAQWAIQTRW